MARVWVAVDRIASRLISLSYQVFTRLVKPCNDSWAGCPLVEIMARWPFRKDFRNGHHPPFSTPRIASTASVSFCSLVRGDESGDGGVFWAGGEIKKALKLAQGLKIYGASGRTRTDDLRFTKSWATRFCGIFPYAIV